MEGLNRNMWSSFIYSLIGCQIQFSIHYGVYSIFCTIRYTYLKKYLTYFYEEIKYFSGKKIILLLFSNNKPETSLIQLN